MEQIYAQLKSPVFWVLTIFGSLVLNVVSHYITRAIDRGAGFIGSLSRDLLDPRGNRRAARDRKYTEWINNTEGGAALLLQKALSYKLTAIIAALVVIFTLASTALKPRHLPFFEGLMVFVLLTYTLMMLVSLNRCRRLETMVDRHKKGFANLPRKRSGAPSMLENVRPEK